VDAGLVIAVALALVFALTNGFHDAANAIATLVATRGATPGQAIALSSVFNMIGAVALGTAVADTIGKIVEVDPGAAVETIGAGLAGATAWNLLTWWRGLPSSSGQALVGGLVGAALAEGGWAAINVGGFDGWRPVGLVGTLVSLLVSPVIGFVFGFVLLRALRLVTRRFTQRWQQPVVGTEWLAAAALSYSHGSNDAQKSMGVIAALLLASGETSSFTVPLWVKIATGLAVTLGTALGGWRIVRTIGSRIFGLRPLDSLASQSSSTAVILGASLIGGPVSTTQVVASSVVGVGGGRRRWRHVRWQVVRDIAAAWLTTIPAAAIMSIVALYIWKGVAAL
jgi:PiT family inorganic phosphate transporter